MKKRQPEKILKKTHYFSRDLNGYFEFCSTLNHAANDQILPHQTPVFLCIGSDRMTGDCLGPLVGHKLKKLFPQEERIYGTLEHPVHAKNLLPVLRRIDSIHAHPFYIAIDASLGMEKHIGRITLSEGCLYPGEGVKKKLPSIGDLAITGIVNSCQGDSSLLLQNTRLHLVNELADFISQGIASGFADYLSF